MLNWISDKARKARRNEKIRDNLQIPTVEDKMRKPLKMVWSLYSILEWKKK